jgi:cytoskeletal protein CcmA (bactofilin family)
MFPKKASQPTRATTDTMSSGGFSMLGADLSIKGDVNATADLHIDGRIEGDITCAALVQGEASEIVGAVTANSAHLAGTVRGTITVVALTIQRSAHIVGDVNYETLTIEQGAKVDGRFAQSGGEKKAEGPLLIGN